jgi:chemotaxis protein histidine kinase CheA
MQGERIDAVCEAAAGLSGRMEALANQLEPLLEAVSRERRTEARAARESLDRCSTMLESLVVSAWSLRMVEVEPALEETVSYGRALAASLGKQLRIEVRAPGVEVERGVLDELLEPLLHLVRNALDHGIEPPDQRGAKDPTGRLLIEAHTTGPLLLLRLSDDGRGIDLETVRAAAVRRGLFDEQTASRLSESELRSLLFAHGFSTRREASEISGRGVGLDVVRTRLSALGGSVMLETKPGAGTSFTLTVPARITREKVLLFESAGALWGLPGESVEEVLRIGETSLQACPTGQALLQRGQRIPFRSFRELLGGEPEDDAWAIVIDWGEHRCALGATSLVGEADLLRRPADRLVSSLGPIAASGSNGDGRLVLLVSLEALFDRFAEAAPARHAESQPAKRRRRVLVVDDSATVRDFLSGLLKEAGIEVQPASSGQAALALLQQSPPDLVLTDLEMPGMSGLELLREVRTRHPRIPVVMLTTRASPEDRQRAAELGASAYLVKSQLQESVLLETLARNLGDRS